MLAVICCLAYARGYAPNQIEYANDDQRGYANAIGIDQALTGNDDYAHQRINQGVNYSPIAKLDCAESTDRATSLINSCLRSFAPEAAGSEGFSNLCHVIGEMHSNVWDHGLNTGFSMAQKTKVPNEEDNFFEFSLADSGLGFVAGMLRCGIPRNSDADAIAWCIKEGHSTKKTDDRDEFAQRIPTDHLGGSPFGEAVEHYQSDGNENHHQGLGLFHLTRLVVESSGELCLASGDAFLHVSVNGEFQYFNLERAWNGVALSCRLRASRLLALAATPNDEVIDIYERIRGG